MSTCSVPLISGACWNFMLKISLWQRSQQVLALAFSGIHVISPHLLTMMIEDGAFSAIASYLRLAAQGEKILAFRADEYYWRDLGKPENIELAADDLNRKLITQ